MNAWRNTLADFIARHLPRRVIYWAAVHLAAYVSVRLLPDEEVPSLLVMDALDAWWREHNL